MSNSAFTYPMSLLGLSLTSYPDLIQWWEYTGLIGGSLWILLVNLFIYNLIGRVNLKNAIGILIIVIIPPIFSFYLSKQELKATKSAIGFYAIRTDLPAKEEKYNMSYAELTQHLATITKKEIEKDTSIPMIIVCPETALVRPKNITNLKDKDFDYLQNQHLINDNRAIITGCLLKNYNPSPFKLAHDFKHKGVFVGEEYFIFNSISLLSKNKIDYRVKEKLVPFNEYLPYYQFFWEKAAHFLYNGIFHFSTYQNRKNFTFKDINITPLICYESFIGNFVRKFSNTDIIVVGLNEGWYNSKKGFRLAEGHAIARAIENRKEIIKSSNCGIASYINHKGKVINYNNNQESGFLVYPNFYQKRTIYHQYGDYLGLMACIVFCLQMLVILIGKIRSISTKVS